MKKRARQSVKLKVQSKPKAGTRDAILEPLVAFNRKAVGPQKKYRVVAIPIEDPKTGQVIGGLWGEIWYRWLFVELLFIPEKMRRSDLGTRLIKLAEREARAYGCVGIWLDTFSFQAKPFYNKLGFREFGMIKGFPPGHSRHYLCKRLSGGR